MRLMFSLVISIFLYACETWTLTTELKRRIQSLGMRCYRRNLHKDHITNEEVHSCVWALIGPYEEFLIRVKKKEAEMVWACLPLIWPCQDNTTVNGTRRRGRQKKRWEDNVKKWQDCFAASQRAVGDRTKWREMMMSSSLTTRQPIRVICVKMVRKLSTINSYTRLKFYIVRKVERDFHEVI